MIVLSRLIFSILCLILLVGCSSLPAGFSRPTIPIPSAPTETKQGQVTPAIELTSISATPLPVLMATPVTPSPALTVTFTPPAVNTPAGPAQLTRAAGCNLAAAGKPIDMTIPDNTRLKPGDSFLKTWRLVNVGTCTWTRRYTAVWFSGENLASRKEEPFREDVLPGQSVDLSIDMVAPQKAGSYQSNWKLRDENGQLFGIGPNAASPFWVRIEVVDPESVALTPFSTKTSISLIYSAGNAVLVIGQSFDLDEALAGPTAGDDIFLRLTNNMIEIVPSNGSRLAVVGPHTPGPSDCREIQTLNAAIILSSESQNSYLCVWTDKGLPASVFVARVDALKGLIDIHFTVWSAP